MRLDMTFPPIPDAVRLERLRPPVGRVRMVLDTDTYNETDDQFALVHALLSPERLAVEAVHAAPFHNDRSDGPGHGMELSYQEILRLLERLGRSADGFAFRGSTGYLGAGGQPCESEAVRDLVARGLASPDDDPLYVVAIGAITNVASALLAEPALAGKIVVVWLGGHALTWPDTREFNLRQDVPAARVGPGSSGASGLLARNILAISAGRSRARWRAVCTTLASTCRVSAPLRERLPPQTLVGGDDGGRTACSARQVGGVYR